jgi:hypothetical protein
LQAIPESSLPLLDNAIEEFETMLRSDPNNSFTLREYGYALFKKAMTFPNDHAEFCTNPNVKSALVMKAVKSLKVHIEEKQVLPSSLLILL